MKAYREGYDTPVQRARRWRWWGRQRRHDGARCAKRLGAEEVSIVYRRGEEEMPARLEEIHHAKEEGIVFRFLTAPVAVHGDENGRVRALECVRMELGEPDASGRRRPVEIPGSRFQLEADMVIAAIGNSPNPLIRSTTPGWKPTAGAVWWLMRIPCAPHGKVFMPAAMPVTGAATVILAMGAGKHAARSIDEYIRQKEGQKGLILGKIGKYSEGVCRFLQFS